MKIKTLDHVKDGDTVTIRTTRTNLSYIDVRLMDIDHRYVTVINDKHLVVIPMASVAGIEVTYKPEIED